MSLSLLKSLAETTTYGADPDASAAIVAPLLIAGLVLAIALIVATWKVYQKAGKPGWAAIIPVYNLWVLFEIAGKPGWWSLLVFIPFIGGLIVLVLEVIAVMEIAKRFGRSELFGFFLLFLIPIGWFILGFGKDQYQVSGVASNQGGQPGSPASPVAS